MNRTITLIRNAEAVKDLTLDIGRELNETGKKNLEKLQETIINKKIKADRIICSTATRSIQTAKEIAPKLGVDPADIMQDQGIYLAHLDEMLKIVKSVPDSVTNLVIIGHNPGITALSRFAVKKYHEVMAPGNLISLEIKLGSWSKIEDAQLEKIK
jgi:phosphohistidine phosphatase